MRAVLPLSLAKGQDDASIVDRSKVKLIDRRVAQHGGRRKMPLPMRGLDAAPDEFDFFLAKATVDHGNVGIALQEARENRVRAGVADSEVGFVRLAGLEIGAWGFFDQRRRHAQIARQCPDLTLEEIADWIEGRRVICMPGEIS